MQKPTRISPRTGRPVRAYDNSISLSVRALNWDFRAYRQLVTKWPEGARCGNKLEPWHRHLAAIQLMVMTEPPQTALPYTPPQARNPLTAAEKEILFHAEHRAAGGFYCGGSPEMDALVARGLMYFAGRKAFCPDPYYHITAKGRAALRAATA